MWQDARGCSLCVDVFFQKPFHVVFDKGVGFALASDCRFLTVFH